MFFSVVTKPAGWLTKFFNPTVHFLALFKYKVFCCTTKKQFLFVVPNRGVANETE